jgi:hypothetical protein
MGKAVEARQGFDEALAILRKQSPGGSAVLARVLWRSATARMETKAPADLAAALRELDEAVSMAKDVSAAGPSRSQGIRRHARPVQGGTGGAGSARGQVTVAPPAELSAAFDVATISG